MSTTRISESLRLLIVSQFESRCAYCQTQQEISGVRLTVDHIIPESLGGSTEAPNLCLACWDCNLYKAARISVYDNASQRTIRLFHPRNQSWFDHFEWSSDGSLMIDKTTTGRVSISSLRLNRVALTVARKLWADVGWHPPS